MRGSQHPRENQNLAGIKAKMKRRTNFSPILNTGGWLSTGRRMLEYKVLESALRSTNIFCFSSFELNFPSEPEEERIKVFHLLSLSAVGWARFQRPTENIRFSYSGIHCFSSSILEVLQGCTLSILTRMRKCVLAIGWWLQQGGKDQDRAEGRGAGQGGRGTAWVNCRPFMICSVGVHQVTTLIPAIGKRCQHYEGPSLTNSTSTRF